MSKHWGKEYLLDPLTAPEPSQETGPGTSHYNALRGSLNNSLPIRSASTATNRARGSSASHSRIPSNGTGSSATKNPMTTPEQARGSRARYPTPPGSASPTRGSFHSSNPWSSKSSETKSFAASQELSPPNSPPSDAEHLAQAQSSPRAPLLRRSSSTGFAEAQISGNDLKAALQRSASTRTSASADLSRRQSVLRERYPGDMSHRPLDVLKEERRMADRRRRPKRVSETDIIDSLDTIGGAYHHGGPYDATLASRNMYKKYSPLAAVEFTNREALKATPKEFIIDSLTLHVPLQGTSTVPSGSSDLRGNVMEYEEGADLMREPDAPGGAYKRWDGVQYHPDDLKGKGEPSFSYDRDAKNRKQELGRLLGEPGEYEMTSNMKRSNSSAAHKRTVSEGVDPTASGSMFGQMDGGVRRSYTTGKKFSEGIRRRFGSLRGRKEVEA